MSINLDCYLQFKKEKEDTHATCGVVVFHDATEVFENFTVYEDGLYGNGLLNQLFKVLNFINTELEPGAEVNLFIKLHPKNTNFKKILAKVERGYQLTKTVENDVSFGFILKQLFTNKDYTKPNTFEWMIRIVKALKLVNRTQTVNLFVGVDAKSYRADRTYIDTVARHKAYTDPKELENKPETIGC